MDTLSTHVKRDVRRALDDREEVSTAVVDAYYAATHTADVTLTPTRRMGVGLQVAPPYGLWDYRPGDTCVVLLCYGQPVVVICPLHTDARPVPGTIALPGDAFVNGDLTVSGAFRPATLYSLPVASTRWVNTVVVVAAQPAANGNPAVPSQPYLCVDAGDGATYTWKKLSLS